MVIIELIPHVLTSVGNTLGLSFRFDLAAVKPQHNLSERMQRPGTHPTCPVAQFYRDSSSATPPCIPLARQAGIVLEPKSVQQAAGGCEAGLERVHANGRATSGPL